MNISNSIQGDIIPPPPPPLPVPVVVDVVVLVGAVPPMLTLTDVTVVPEVFLHVNVKVVGVSTKMDSEPDTELLLDIFAEGVQLLAFVLDQLIVEFPLTLNQVGEAESEIRGLETPAVVLGTIAQMGTSL